MIGYCKSCDMFNQSMGIFSVITLFWNFYKRLSTSLTLLSSDIAIGGFPLIRPWTNILLKKVYYITVLWRRESSYYRVCSTRTEEAKSFHNLITFDVRKMSYFFKKTANRSYFTWYHISAFRLPNQVILHISQPRYLIFGKNKLPCILNHFRKYHHKLPWYT